MTPLPHFASYDAALSTEQRADGMYDNSFDEGMDPMPRGVGRTTMVEIMLGPELLSTLCRRSRRRLRDIQANCQVAMKLDRTRCVLRIFGPEACIEAAQKQLSSLGGPRKTVPAAVWAELMRTRTLQSSKQAIVLLIQELSGCRIHIERSRHEVRIFGPQDGTVIAEKLIEELEKQCTEEAVPAHNPTFLCMASLQEMAHMLGVTLRLEDEQVIVLGLQERVKLAAREIMKYTTDPEGYHFQLSPLETAAISSAAPALSLEGLDLSDAGSRGSRGSSSSAGSEGMQISTPVRREVLRSMPQPTFAAQTPPSHKPAMRGPSPRSQFIVAARQAQAFEQLRGPQAGGKNSDCGVCPTCGVGRYCLFCGQQTWVYNANSGCWRELGSQCGPGHHHDGGVLKPQRQALAHEACSGQAGAHGGAAGDVSPASSGTPMMTPSQGQGYLTMEALDSNQCSVGPGPNGMVMGGMVPMCFMAGDQNSQMPWVGGMPVAMAQGYPDGSGNGNQIMRHVYMVPAYSTLHEEQVQSCRRMRA